MNKIDTILKCIAAHNKKKPQCEKCVYDGSDCIKGLLKDVAKILREVNGNETEEQGDDGHVTFGRFVELSRVGEPLERTESRIERSAHNTRREDARRAIRNAMNQFERTTGNEPNEILMTRNLFLLLMSDEHMVIQSPLDPPHLYGMRVRMCEAPMRNGAFEIAAQITGG